MADPKGFLKYDREIPATRAVVERIKDQKEIYLAEPEEHTVHQAARCMDCGVPFCHSGCPLGNIIPDFNDAVYREHWDEAYTILRSTNNFPEFEHLIKAYYGSWKKMLHGAFTANVRILRKLIDREFRMLALTNWSNETFPIALELYEFLHWFEGILISGKEKLKKPDPAIFNLLVRRYHLIPGQTLFIDDNQNNISSAARLGFDTVLFTDTAQLVFQLESRGIVLD